MNGLQQQQNAYRNIAMDSSLDVAYTFTAATGANTHGRREDPSSPTTILGIVNMSKENKQNSNAN